MCSTAETVAKEMPGLISMGTSESASCKQTEDFSQIHSSVRVWGLQDDARGQLTTHHTHCVATSVAIKEGGGDRNRVVADKRLRRKRTNLLAITLGPQEADASAAPFC